MAFIRNFLALLAAFSLVFCASVTGSYAATIYAASTSYSDVAAAVSSASSGDTVIVPAGTATWESKLTITKGLNLIGAGIGQTVITNGISGGGNDQCFAYSPSSPALNETFRLSGFTFTGDNTALHAITVGNKSRTPISNVRIDHNKIQNFASYALYFTGEVYACVDNNTFEDLFMVFNSSGYDWYSWIDLYPPDLGSANYVVFEDNTINYTESLPEWNGGLCQAGHGGNYTFRYNTITNYPYYDILDAHGNQQPVTEEYYPGGSRGTISVEIYENDISSDKANASRFLYHRGGTAIVFNNRITGPIRGAIIVMTEEDGPARFNYLDEYPGYDPVENSYYYNNTLNGNPIFPGVTAASTVFIQQGRDYWLANPIGQTIGGSVYTPLQYPHPLTAPSPPLNLRITN